MQQLEYYLALKQTPSRNGRGFSRFLERIGSIFMPESPHYIDRLKMVEAPSPSGDGSHVIVGVNRDLIRRLAAARRTTKLFEYSYLVCGVPPEVNLIGYHERNSSVTDNYQGLKGAHAIFRDLQRPMIDDGVVENVYIYVLSPRFAYRYIPHMVCSAQRTEAPAETVFVVYVRFDASDFSDGEIIGWDWVPRDEQQVNLPNDYSNRYGNEVWNNG